MNEWVDVSKELAGRSYSLCHKVRTSADERTDGRMDGPTDSSAPIHACLPVWSKDAVFGVVSRKETLFPVCFSHVLFCFLTPDTHTRLNSSAFAQRVIVLLLLLPGDIVSFVWLFVRCASAASVATTGMLSDAR